jgi:hypothetical protein
MSLFLMDIQGFKSIGPMDDDPYFVRCQRNAKDDVITAINLAFELKEKIDKLHPFALELFQRIISN